MHILVGNRMLAHQREIPTAFNSRRLHQFMRSWPRGSIASVVVSKYFPLTFFLYICATSLLAKVQYLNNGPAMSNCQTRMPRS
jgi:hypothetical protein